MMDLLSESALLRMTKGELKDMLEERGCSTDGVKSVLVARLRDSAASEGEEERENERPLPLCRRVIKKDAGDEVAVVCNSVMGVFNTTTKDIISDEPDVDEIFSVHGFADHCGLSARKNGWACVYVVACERWVEMPLSNWMVNWSEMPSSTSRISKYTDPAFAGILDEEIFANMLIATVPASLKEGQHSVGEGDDGVECVMDDGVGDGEDDGDPESVDDMVHDGMGDGLDNGVDQGDVEESDGGEFENVDGGPCVISTQEALAKFKRFLERKKSLPDLVEIRGRVSGVVGSVVEISIGSASVMVQHPGMAINIRLGALGTLSEESLNQSKGCLDMFRSTLLGSAHIESGICIKLLIRDSIPFML